MTCLLIILITDKQSITFLLKLDDLSELEQRLNMTLSLFGSSGCGELSSENGSLSDEQIILLIELYVEAYEEVTGQSSDVSIMPDSSDSDITSAIGQIMRRTTQTQQQLEQNASYSRSNSNYGSSTK